MITMNRINDNVEDDEVESLEEDESYSQKVDEDEESGDEEEDKVEKHENDEAISGLRIPLKLLLACGPSNNLNNGSKVEALEKLANWIEGELVRLGISTKKGVEHIELDNDEGEEGEENALEVALNTLIPLLGDPNFKIISTALNILDNLVLGLLNNNNSSTNTQTSSSHLLKAYLSMVIPPLLELLAETKQMLRQGANRILNRLLSYQSKSEGEGDEKDETFLYLFKRSVVQIALTLLNSTSNNSTDSTNTPTLGHSSPKVREEVVNFLTGLMLLQKKSNTNSNGNITDNFDWQDILVTLVKGPLNDPRGRMRFVAFEALLVMTSCIGIDRIKEYLSNESLSNNGAGGYDWLISQLSFRLENHPHRIAQLGADGLLQHAINVPVRSVSVCLGSGSSVSSASYSTTTMAAANNRNIWSGANNNSTNINSANINNINSRPNSSVLGTNWDDEVSASMALRTGSSMGGGSSSSNFGKSAPASAMISTGGAKRDNNYVPLTTLHLKVGGASTGSSNNGAGESDGRKTVVAFQNINSNSNSNSGGGRSATAAAVVFHGSPVKDSSAHSSSNQFEKTQIKPWLLNFNDVTVVAKEKNFPGDANNGNTIPSNFTSNGNSNHSVAGGLVSASTHASNTSNTSSTSNVRNVLFNKQQQKVAVTNSIQNLSLQSSSSAISPLEEFKRSLARFSISSAGSTNSNDWQVKSQNMEIVRNLIKSESIALNSLSHDTFQGLMLGLTEEIGNLRSGVARTAISTLAEIFRGTVVKKPSPSMLSFDDDDEQQQQPLANRARSCGAMTLGNSNTGGIDHLIIVPIINALIKKAASADGNQFMQGEIDNCLYCLFNHCILGLAPGEESYSNPSNNNNCIINNRQILNCLLNQHLEHKAVSVRLKVANCLSYLSDPKKQRKRSSWSPELERIVISGLVPLAFDSSAEVRQVSRNALCQLANEDNFDRCLDKSLNPARAAEVRAAIAKRFQSSNSRERRIPKTSTASSASASSLNLNLNLNLNNGEQQQQQKTNPTNSFSSRSAPPGKSKAQRNDDIFNEKSWEDEDSGGGLARLEQGLKAPDWKERLESLQKVARVVTANHHQQLSREQSLRLLDPFSERLLNDGNAKVQLAALSILPTLITSVKDSLDVLCAPLLNSLASGPLNSSNAQIRSLASQALDRLVDQFRSSGGQGGDANISNKKPIILLQSMASCLNPNPRSNWRVKVSLLEKLSDFIRDSSGTVFTNNLQKTIVPTINRWLALKDADFGRTELRNAINGLASSLKANGISLKIDSNLIAAPSGTLNNNSSASNASNIGRESGCGNAFSDSSSHLLDEFRMLPTTPRKSFQSYPMLAKTSSTSFNNSSTSTSNSIHRRSPSKG